MKLNPSRSTKSIIRYFAIFCCVFLIIVGNVWFYYLIRTPDIPISSTDIKPAECPVCPSCPSSSKIESKDNIKLDNEKNPSLSSNINLSPSMKIVPNEFIQPKRFAYVLYATNQQYACGALVAFRRLRDLGANPNIEFVALIKGLSTSTTQAFIDNNIQVINVNDMPTRSGYYNDVMVKMAVFRLFQYDKIILFDVDSLPMQNLDHLFYLAPGTPLAAPWAYWENEPCLTSLLLVVEPSIPLWNRVKNHIYSGRRFDMDILNIEFEHRSPGLKGRILPELLILPSYYGILNSDFINIEKFHHNHTYLYSQAKIIHFSAYGKPWARQPSRVLIDNPKAHPLLKNLYETWHEISQLENVYKHRRKSRFELDIYTHLNYDPLINLNKIK